jgi:hypothetical protein
MNISELQEQWEIDSEIDGVQLDIESIKSSKLHSKYIGILVESKLKLIKLRQEYANLRTLKFRYYRGELSRTELTELNWAQCQLGKPLKSEMDEILKGDTDLTTIETKIEYIVSMIYMLESILNSIKDRTWSIRNAIEFKKFQAGV